jgi:hypothetical protein
MRLKPHGIYVEAYSDAAFATHHDMRSHTGILCTLAGAPYYMSSTRQRINAKSAAEAEMIAISDSGTMIQWGQQFLEHQGYVLPPAKIWEDNQATVMNLARGASTATNSRHYDVRYFYLADLERRNIVNVEWLETGEMTADIFTKGVSGPIFNKLSDKLLNSVSDVNKRKATTLREEYSDVESSSNTDLRISKKMRVTARRS